MFNSVLMSSLKKAIDDSGGNSVVAEKLGVSSQQLSNWIKRGVPTEHCAALEAALGGRVTRRDLRPADWHRIWPELRRSPAPPRAIAASAQISSQLPRRVRGGGSAQRLHEHPNLEQRPPARGDR